MGSELPDYHKVARRFTTLSYTAFVRFSFNIKTFNSDKPNHCLKEDSTMFFLLVFLVLCTAVTSGQNCPKEKRVGDTCYTRGAMAHTHQYGCMENCSYKKTNSSDTGLYCFKTGSLQVTECGNSTGGGYLEEAYINIGVTCGSDVRKDFCFQCGDTFDSCQGADLHPDCILDNKTCIPNNREWVPPFRPGPGTNGEPNSLCYYFSNTLVNSWMDAENGCLRRRSHLAPVNNSTQQDFIVNVIDPTTSDKIFIGGTSMYNTDLKFYWLLTSTPLDDGFTFWGPGEPNFKGEQCIEMIKTGYVQPWMWNNCYCDNPYPPGLRSYVCAYDPKIGSSIRGSSIHG